MKWNYAIKTAAALALSLTTFGAWASTQAADASTAAPADAGQADYEVVVYWAPWCSACGPVLSSMDELADGFAGKNVRFTAANIGDASNAQRALQRKGGEALTLRQVDAAEAGVRAVPWIVVRDASGKVVSTPAAQTHPTHMAQWVKMDLAFRL